MAFWRPMTMDSWNPFSPMFWSIGNLFGQSIIETLESVKSRRHTEIHELIEITNPEKVADELNILRDPFTHERLGEDTVITVEGVIYNRETLVKRLLLDKTVPGSSIPLENHLFIPFPELNAELDYITHRLQAYRDKKYKIILAAVKALGVDKSVLAVNHPDVFRCAYSGMLMETPVITPQGVVVDERVMTRFFREGGHICKVTGVPISQGAIEPFPELARQLREYDSLLANVKDAAMAAAKKVANTFTSLFNILGDAVNKASPVMPQCTGSNRCV